MKRGSTSKAQTMSRNKSKEHKERTNIQSQDNAQKSKGRNTKRGPTSSLKLRHRQQPPKTKGTKKHLVWTLCELKDKKSINSPNKAIMK